jgi:hypothetical protein
MGDSPWQNHAREIHFLLLGDALKIGSSHIREEWILRAAEHPVR